MVVQNNVLGQVLQTCGVEPLTGFTREGTCKTGPEDVGVHGVCALVTHDFLEFSKKQGNDLSAPRPEFGFPGLKPGDRWCLCAARWQEALENGVAPPVILSATNSSVLGIIRREDLLAHAREEGQG